MALGEFPDQPVVSKKCDTCGETKRMYDFYAVCEECAEVMAYDEYHNQGGDYA